MPANQLLDPDLQAQCVTLCATWRKVLAVPTVTQALSDLSRMLKSRCEAGATIYPQDPFRALRTLNPSDIKVVILGQDPYHGPGQAQGMAFSVPDDMARPPSLRNIFLEIDREFSDTILAAPARNDLTRWATQGVLLLNTVLTVEDGKPASHAKMGWETVTDALIEAVATDSAPKVFMLWGNHAQAKRSLIENRGQHLILMANHPSPLSARRPPVPFLGCDHFMQANEWLLQQNRQPIDWKE